jgi:hypothetical protein
MPGETTFLARSLKTSFYVEGPVSSLELVFVENLENELKEIIIKDGRKVLRKFNPQQFIKQLSRIQDAGVT